MHFGQVGQPKPEAVRRTAPPVTTMRTWLTSESQAYKRIRFGENKIYGLSVAFWGFALGAAELNLSLVSATFDGFRALSMHYLPQVLHSRIYAVFAPLRRE